MNVHLNRWRIIDVYGCHQFDIKRFEIDRNYYLYLITVIACYVQDTKSYYCLY